MTKDKFRELCDHVLIPRLGDLLHHQLVDLLQTLEVHSDELIRIGERLDRIECWLAGRDDHEEEA